MTLTEREARAMVATGDIPETIRVVGFIFPHLAQVPYYAISFGAGATWLLTERMIDDLATMCQEAKAAVPDD